MTRPAARRHIERAFDQAVLEVLDGCRLADLRIVVLEGGDNLPPAVAVICGSVGQLDLGWIEKNNVLSNTLFGPVAPVRWRATAYQTLVETLHAVLPVFGYADLFQEIAMYYWEGETDDDAARRCLIEWHGCDPADMGEITLPSEMNGRRPDWMLPENTAPLKQLPPGLRQRLRRIRKAHAALKALGREGNAWRFQFDTIVDYLPEFEDCSHLPPLTLVPFDHFARELDDVARHGMETGFMDVAGLCPLADHRTLDAWFASLRLGAELLLAVQDLIESAPSSFHGAA